jgi:hypothetical protein
MPLALPSATARNTSHTSMRPGTTVWSDDTPMGRPTPRPQLGKTVPFFRIGGTARRNRIPVLLHSSPASPLLQGQEPPRSAREKLVLLHFPCSPQARSTLLVSHPSMGIARDSHENCVSISRRSVPEGYDTREGDIMFTAQSAHFSHTQRPQSTACAGAELHRQRLRTNCAYSDDTRHWIGPTTWNSEH